MSYFLYREITCLYKEKGSWIFSYLKRIHKITLKSIKSCINPAANLWAKDIKVMPDVINARGKNFAYLLPAV